MRNQLFGWSGKRMLKRCAKCYMYVANRTLRSHDRAFSTGLYTSTVEIGEFRG
jgi:hypothetical protein